MYRLGVIFILAWIVDVTVCVFVQVMRSDDESRPSLGNLVSDLDIDLAANVRMRRKGDNKHRLRPVSHRHQCHTDNCASSLVSVIFAIYANTDKRVMLVVCSA